MAATTVEPSEYGNCLRVALVIAACGLSLLSSSNPQNVASFLLPWHMIKCHGNKNDATFWGFEDESKDKPHAAITSATLRQLPYSEGSTVVAAMCCYGAQIFSPKDADTWPLASTY